MLVEVHVLKNLPPGCLNRDDSGAPKSCIFGGTTRARLSSQSIKRAMRQSFYFKNMMQNFNDTPGYRTRKLPELVGNYLRSNGVSEDYILAAMTFLSKLGQKEASNVMKDEDIDEENESEVTKTSIKGKSKKNIDPKNLITPQIMFISDHDIEVIGGSIKRYIDEGYTVDQIRDLKNVELSRYTEKDIKQRKKSPDIALFGRMVTSEHVDDVESAVQVAHSLSTFSTEVEYDFFTAVDDLNSGEETGAGMMGESQFNSGCHYMYANLNVGAFINNLGLTIQDFRKEPNSLNNALKVTEYVTEFIKAFILTLPAGKQNAFAAYAMPSFVALETSNTILPCSYANAFVNGRTNEDNHVEAAIKRLTSHMLRQRHAYSQLAEKDLHILQPEYDRNYLLERYYVDNATVLIKSLKETVANYLISG